MIYARFLGVHNELHSDSYPFQIVKSSFFRSPIENIDFFVDSPRPSGNSSSFSPVRTDEQLDRQRPSDMGCEELIALDNRLPPLRFRVGAKVTYMRRAFDQRQTSCNSLVDERVICLLRLLPRDQIITRAVDEKRRRLIIATHNLGHRTDWDEFVGRGLRKRIPISHCGACGMLLAGKATDYDGQCLRLPVDV